MREFGSDFESVSLSDNYFRSQCALFKNYEFTRTGREAIRLICNSIKSGNITNKKNSCILPSYICPSMVIPFESEDWDIHYYSMKEDFTIDLTNLSDQIRKYNPLCVLIVNYFGNNVEKTILKSIKKIDSKVNIIYDVTHSLLSLPDIYNKNIDYYIASLRKWFGIANGGLVLTNNFLNKSIVEDIDYTDFTKLQDASMDFKKNYLITNDEKLKRELKTNISKAKSFLKTENIFKISGKSLNQLNSLNISQIKFKRNFNFLHLWDNIKAIPKIKLAFNFNIDNKKNYSFMLPLLFEDRDIKQQQLSDAGLYSQVIWDIPYNARQCKYSNSISNRILCIPIDQRYDYWDIVDISKIIKNNL